MFGEIQRIMYRHFTIIIITWPIPEAINTLDKNYYHFRFDTSKTFKRILYIKINFSQHLIATLVYSSIESMEGK